MDKLTPSQRHHCMASIRSKNTRPEWVVRRFLFSNGFRYRIHAKVLSGTPDITLVGLRTCIFINGCFWHGHEDCSLYVTPKSNTNFWINKVQRNRERDAKALHELKQAGWHTITIWECQLKPKEREATLQGLLRSLNLIKLENMGAKFHYNFDQEDEYRTYAAEE